VNGLGCIPKVSAILREKIGERRQEEHVKEVDIRPTIKLREFTRE
jgi:hypothetical protein